MLCLLLWLCSQASGQDTNATQQVVNFSRCKLIVVKQVLDHDQENRLQALRAVRPKLFANKEKRTAYSVASAQTARLVAEALILISATETELARFEDVVRREMPYVQLPPLAFDECLMIILVSHGVDPQRKT
ncbi:MAG: hypothetical protein AAB776_01190 [Patescibacteria group bacterium]